MEENQEKYIPINKGHFELEPPERIAAFAKKLGSGWETEYADYRRMWRELPEKQIVRDYPLLVDLEMASVCNLKCPMCPTTTSEFIHQRSSKANKGLMDADLAKRIIDEIAGKVYALRLSWVGEPTLHKKLVDVVRYAKEKGIQEVSFLTNGWKLELEYFIQLQTAGVDWITISIDGMDEIYDRIRAPLKFRDTVKKLQRIAAYKEEHGLQKPVIKIQGVWPAVRDRAEEFYNIFAPITDLIAYNPLIDYLHNDTNIVYEDSFVCPQQYERITISANGTVALCSNDDNVEVVLGDAHQESIHSIWHGDAMQAIREQQKKKNGFMEINPCKKCYYPRKTESNESATINGRVFVIENYLNRSQTIGE
ncbi:MAG: SPASM domain-containing protein [Spirochaetales bacterium]|nr:SPASM domain-containing protein [Spirochaetales bacterium]